MELFIQNISEFILIHWKVLFILCIVLNIFTNIAVIIRGTTIPICVLGGPQIRGRMLKQLIMLIATHLIGVIFSAFLLYFIPIQFYIKVIIIFVSATLWLAIVTLYEKLYS